MSTAGTTEVAAVLTRTDDFDENSDIYPNVNVAVSHGTTYADTIWQLTSNAPALGSNLEFSQISAANLNDDNLKRVSFIIKASETTGSVSSFSFTHSLNDPYPVVSVIDVDSNEDVFFTIIRNDADTVTVSVNNATDIQGKTFVVHIVGIEDASYVLT